MGKKKIFYLVSIICLSPILMSIADDWTKWRGPQGTGISQETNWNPNALSSNLKILWKANVGKGHSAFAVKGNCLYTMGLHVIQTITDTLYEDIVYCLNAETGKEIWRYAYASRYLRWPGPGSTPVLDGTRLYTLSRDGDLFCFNAQNGRVFWRKNIVNEGLTEIPVWGFCASPFIYKDLLVINACESGLALNKTNGHVIWKSESVQGRLSTPVLYQEDGKDRLAIMANEQLYSVEPMTGKVLWSHPWTTYTDPIVLDDTMLLTGYNDGSALLKIQNNQPEIIWQNKRVHASSFINFVVVNGYAYGSVNDRRKQPFQCINLKTGKAQWTKDLGDWGSLIAAGNYLIILDGDGDLIIANAVPEGFQIVSQAKLFRLEHWRRYPDGDPNCCWTAPVLANGKIYSRTTWGEMVCVDVSNQ